MIALDAETRLQDYAGVTAPTLLIVGSKTRAPAKAVVELLARTLPNATVTVLRGAGHMSPFTHPLALNRLILEQLAARR
jgi:pimeloyl-ACP methyl ester carboxylesterase